MALNPFIGWTQAQLEAQLLAAQEDLAAGAAVVSAGAGDTNTSQSQQLQIMQRIEMLYRALHILDPVKYPSFQVFRRDRTHYAAP